MSVVSLQGGSGDLVPDHNRYFLKAENCDPVPIVRFHSHPGLFTKISKPLTLKCHWTRPLINWMKKSIQTSSGKLRLDRVSPGGRVIASFDLTGRRLTGFRIGDTLTGDLHPVVTLDGPPAEQVLKNATPQSTDTKVFTIDEVQLFQRVGSKNGPVDWGMVSPRDLKITGEPGHHGFSAMGALKPGKGIPSPGPDNMTIRLNLRSPSEPKHSVFFVIAKPTIQRIQSTSQISIKSNAVGFNGGSFP